MRIIPTFWEMERRLERIESLVLQGWRPRVKPVKGRNYITMRKGPAEISLGPYSSELWMKVSNLVDASLDPSLHLNKPEATDVYRKVLGGASFEQLVSQHDPYLVRRVFRDFKADGNFMGKILMDKHLVLEHEIVRRNYDSLVKSMVPYIQATKLQIDEQTKRGDFADKRSEMLLALFTRTLESSVPKISQTLTDTMVQLGLDPTEPKVQEIINAKAEHLLGAIVDIAQSNIVDVFFQVCIHYQTIVPRRSQPQAVEKLRRRRHKNGG